MSRMLLGVGFLAGLLIGFAQADALKDKDLEVVLRLKERVPLTRLAEQVSDPRSPRYRRFYTPDEIRQVAGPADQDYALFMANLEKKGFKIVSESKTHLIVTISGPKETYESVFSTRIVLVNGPVNGHVDGSSAKHRSEVNPTIPADLSLIASLSGLDTTRSSHPFHKIGPREGTGMQPGDIQQAYGLKPIYQAGITGKGQHIAIATYDDYYHEDPHAYYLAQSVKPEPHVDAINFNGTAKLNTDSAMETELDTEFSGMIAPGAQIHVFTSAHNDDPGEIQLFTAILDDNRAKVANYSWGDCEAHISAQHFQDMNTVFARAVAQGVNLLVAAGDWGAAGCPPSRGSKFSADWPAANPYVVAVGGTTLWDVDHGQVNEIAWSDTGGGISAVWDLPSWQQALGSPYLKRSFPDVAFNADVNTGEPAYVHYEGVPDWLQFGGTSIASPQWAGFLALVGEARAGLPGLGYLNPVIYGMSATDRAQGFNDVVKGNNGGYSAGKGWDATTGWGSMRGSELLDLLRKN